MIKNIFLSWSKDRSLALAQSFRKLIHSFPEFDENFNTIISTDLSKGTPWIDKLREQIDLADICIVFLTPENLRSEWINFEVGALANKFGHEKIFTLLLDVNPADFTGPISIYQSTVVAEEDIQSMLRDMEILEKDEVIPGHSWLHFLEEIEVVRQNDFERYAEQFQEYFKCDPFTERIENSSRQDWVRRYGIVQQTISQLESLEDDILKYGRMGVKSIYLALKNQLYGYATEFKSEFIVNKVFQSSEISGKLDIDQGTLRRVGARFDRINRYKQYLIDNEHIPFLQESVDFQFIEIFEEKKIIIHKYEHKIKEKSFPVARSQWNKMRNSRWNLERIVYYLMTSHEINHNREQELLDFSLNSIKSEFEKVKSQHAPITLIPLHYSIKSLKIILYNLDDSHLNAPSNIYSEISEFINERDFLDNGNQVKENLNRLIELVNAKNANHVT